MRKQATRLAVQKTYKLFIGGKFARGENGRVIAARDGHGNVLANYSRASRKDFRDAVRAARSAIPGWTKCSPYLRGQILYRAAEMLEGRRLELESELARVDRSGAGARGDDPSAFTAREFSADEKLVGFLYWQPGNLFGHKRQDCAGAEKRKC